jgi:hypothetical protein
VALSSIGELSVTAFVSLLLISLLLRGFVVAVVAVVAVDAIIIAQ